MSTLQMESNLISLISVIFILLVSMAMTGCATPLINAAAEGNINAIKNLLDKGANMNESGPCVWDGYLGGGMAGPPLICAAWGGHMEAAKALLDRGADIHAKGKWGRSALWNAASRGHADVVKLLIERGADIDEAMAQLQSDGRNEGFYLVQRLAKKQQPANQPEASKNLTKEDMEKIVQAAVEKAAKPKEKEGRPVSTGQTDIDKPSFAIAERIFGDNDIAVVIGIEGYQSLPKSDFSYDDARLVKDYLKALGFKERNIELITDEKATKSSIEKTLEAWLKNKAKADSKVFVYYSGHGAPDPSTGEAYLVPYDGDPNYLSVTGYPLKRLYDNLGKLQVAEVTVVLDSCFSGAGGRSVLAQGARPLVMMTTSTVLPQNIAVLSATQGTQISTSSPEKGHGIFTYYFLKAIKDGKKDIAEIYEYIKPLVEDDAKQINVQQSPSISPDVEKLKGRFGLRK
ncbi:MAG: caspase family protein [Thermodesulfovibrionales bacterium]|nr:caspase family protein [Thermodesulfovibrionales bacterium]